MSGTRRTSQRRAQRRLPTRTYNDPFLSSPTTQTEVYPTNKQYGYQRSHNAVPNAARSGWNQQTSGRSRGQRGTNLVGISGGSAMPRIGIGIPFKPLQTSFCNERVVNRVVETLELILKFTEFPQDFLIHVLLPCIPSEKAAILVAGVLLCAAKRMGKDKIGKLWRESQLEWRDFFGYSFGGEDFIKKNQLEFLAILTNSEVQLKALNMAEAQRKSLNMIEAQMKTLTVVETLEPIEKVKKTLLQLLEICDGNESIIYEYIAMNPQTFRLTESIFIRALVSAVIESAISGPDFELDVFLLDHRLSLLRHYVNHDVDLELQVLYAVQSLVERMRHPNGLLRQIFDCLYDADVIEEETFKIWESSTDPNEVAGKAVAVHSVKAFFTWLREAESGEESDE